VIERPEIAAEQVERNGELAPLNAAFTSADIAFLDAAVPFYRLDAHGILAVHGGNPGDMQTFPRTVAEADALTGKDKRAFDKILRMRFVDNARIAVQHTLIKTEHNGQILIVGESMIAAHSPYR
jgi:hypothetical protein